MADEAASETALLDVLTQLDALGIELARLLGKRRTSTP
jgi:hypothetical protein